MVEAAGAVVSTSLRNTQSVALNNLKQESDATKQLASKLQENTQKIAADIQSDTGNKSSRGANLDIKV